MDVGVRSAEELFQFAQRISVLSSDLVNTFNEANRQMNYAMEGWNDQQSQPFEDQFREAASAINQIAEMMDSFSSYVRRYAEYICNAPTI